MRQKLCERITNAIEIKLFAHLFDRYFGLDNSNCSLLRIYCILIEYKPIKNKRGGLIYLAFNLECVIKKCIVRNADARLSLIKNKNYFSN